MFIFELVFEFEIHKFKRKTENKTEKKRNGKEKENPTGPEFAISAHLHFPRVHPTPLPISADSQGPCASLCIADRTLTDLAHVPAVATARQSLPCGPAFSDTSSPL
jgi:hypothetical protein